MLAFIINFLILVSYQGELLVTDDPDFDIEDIRMYHPKLSSLNMNSEQTLDIFFYIGVVMMCASCCVTAFYLLKKAPIVIRKAWGGSWKKKKG